jgi:hypothetical protein
MEERSNKKRFREEEQEEVELEVELEKSAKRLKPSDGVEGEQ